MQHLAVLFCFRHDMTECLPTVHRHILLLCVLGVSAHHQRYDQVTAVCK